MISIGLHVHQAMGSDQTYRKEDQEADLPIGSSLVDKRPWQKGGSSLNSSTALMTVKNFGRASQLRSNAKRIVVMSASQYRNASKSNYIICEFVVIV